MDMLNKLIAYKVCWYNAMYQFFPIAWTNRITTRRYHDSQLYCFTQQPRLVPTHFAYNECVPER